MPTRSPRHGSLRAFERSSTRSWLIAEHGGRSRRGWALLSLGALSAFAGLYAFAVLTVTGQALDASSLGIPTGFTLESILAVSRLRTTVAFGLVAVAGLASVDALVRRQWRPVISAAALVVITMLAAETLRRGLPRPDLGDYAYAHNSYPSGHTALALAAVVAVVWLRPTWLRPWVLVLLGSAAVLVGLGSVTSFAHRASDVVGSVLLAAAISFAVVAVGRPRPPDPAVHRRGWKVTGGIALALAVVCVVMAELGPWPWTEPLLRGGTTAALLGVATLTVTVHAALRFG